ncbi:uncharacterized protein LOC112090962 [Morus notabilis]|uniref:uncharacterized protein LOC112090962 n=1 Tax=Morus notabilis TaxID=981085 RepID=UPI000CED1D04|nr:uncharacterized protein LOC112090962 [Morus notabilis]
MEEQEVLDIAASVGGGIGVWPIKYLGLPLGFPLSKEFWRPVIDKVGKRLDDWKKGLLSKGERPTLIQSVLSNIPIYYLSIFKLLVFVTNVLERGMSVPLGWGQGTENGFVW